MILGSAEMVGSTSALTVRNPHRTRSPSSQVTLDWLYHSCHCSLPLSWLRSCPVFFIFFKQLVLNTYTLESSGKLKNTSPWTPAPEILVHLVWGGVQVSGICLNTLQGVICIGKAENHWGVVDSSGCHPSLGSWLGGPPLTPNLATAEHKIDFLGAWSKDNSCMPGWPALSH